jgi:hypothetical protein
MLLRELNASRGSGIGASSNECKASYIINYYLLLIFIVILVFKNNQYYINNCVKLSIIRDKSVTSDSGEDQIQGHNSSYSETEYWSNHPPDPYSL